MFTRSVIALSALLFLTPISLQAASRLPAVPNDKEWNQIATDAQWLETLRKAQKQPTSTMPRKEQIELVLDNIRKVEEPYNNLINRLSEYHQRTHDPRAASMMASEKIRLGDMYASVLSRYDKALELYRAAQQIDPSSSQAAEHVRLAQQHRYISMDAFAGVRSGMKESDVQKLVGLPREDWIKQLTQNNRVYSVWIYPKSDGGASAIYFDNGVVYHTNWNAAAAPAQKQ